VEGDTLGDGRSLTKADYEALARFRYTLRRFMRFTEEGARAAGLTPQQHQILLAIKGQPDRDWATISQLAEALQLRQNAVGGLVDRCEAAGLVVRIHGTTDRREVRVSLTPKGEAVLEGLSHRNREELNILREALRFTLGRNSAPNG
jgi:DNA-binding MarR family transcriptional regulator